MAATETHEIGIREDLWASTDALGAIAGHVSRNWGDYGYSIRGMRTVGIITFALVGHSDGSRFYVMADRWGNVRDAHTEGEAIAEAERMVERQR